MYNVSLTQYASIKTLVYTVQTTQFVLPVRYAAGSYNLLFLKIILNSVGK